VLLALGNLLVKETAKASLKIAWDKLPASDPFVVAARKTAEKLEKPHLEKDFLRWFHNQYASGELQKLIKGEPYDPNRLLESLASALLLREFSTEQLTSILADFTAVLDEVVLSGKEGELAHRVASAGEHRQMLSSVSSIEMKVDSLSTQFQNAIAPGGKDKKSEWTAKVNLGRELLQKDRIASAWSVFTELDREAQEKDAPASIRARIKNNLGACLLQRRDPSTAIGYFKQAVVFDEKDRKYRANVVLAETLASGGTQEHLAEINDLLASHPKDVHLIHVKHQLLSSLQGPKAAFNWIEAEQKVLEPSDELPRILAESALRAGVLDVARNCAQKVVNSVPNDPYGQFLLAEAIFLRAVGDKETAHLLSVAPTPAEAEQLREADALYSRGLELLDQREHPNQFSLCIGQRGAVRIMLGKWDAALNDLDTAIRLDPKNVTARHNRLVLRIRIGPQDDIAEEALAFLPEAENKPVVLAMLCANLLDTHRPQRVLQLEHEYHKLFQNSYQLGFLKACAEDELEGGHAHEKAYLEAAISEKRELGQALCCIAQLQASVGEHGNADQNFRRSIESEVGENNPLARINYAGYLLSRGRCREACEQYEQSVPLDRDTPFLAKYLMALWRSGEDGPAKCTKTIRGLPLDVRSKRQIAEVRGFCEERLNNLAAAADIWMQLWEKHNEPEYGIHLAFCQFRMPQSEAQAKATLLRALNTGRHPSPQEGMMAAQMLCQLGDVEKGLRVGYEAVIKDLSNHELAMTYLATMFLMVRDDKGFLLPSEVRDGCVVDVALEGAEKKSWLLLSTGAVAADIPNCEPIRDSTVLNALQGKRVGERFSFASFGAGGEIRGEVLTIRAPELKLAHELLERIAYASPQMETLRRITMPDGIETLLSEFREGSKRHIRFVTAYNDERLPFTWLARCLGKGLAESFVMCVRHGGIRLELFPPDWGVTYGMIDTLEKSPRLVIDLTAILYFACIGKLEWLTPHKPKLMVCQSTLDQLKEVAAEWARAKDGLKSLVSDGTIVAFHDVSPEVVGEWRHTVDDALRFIEGLPRQNIVGRSTEPVLGQLEIEAIGQVTVDVLNTVFERNCPCLLADYRLTRLVSRTDFISVAALHVTAVEAKKYSMGEHTEMMADLMRKGVQYVAVSPEMLEEGMRRFIKKNDPQVLTNLLFQMRPRQSAWPKAGWMVAGAMARVLPDAHVLSRTRDMLVDVVMAALFQEGYSHRHVVILKKRLQQQLALAPIHFARCVVTIDMWTKQNPPAAR